MVGAIWPFAVSPFVVDIPRTTFIMPCQRVKSRGTTKAGRTSCELIDEAKYIESQTNSFS